MKRTLSLFSLILLISGLTVSAGLEVGSKVDSFIANADSGDLWQLSEHIGKKNIVIEEAEGGYRVLLAMRSGLGKQNVELRSDVIRSTYEFVKAFAVWRQPNNELRLYIDGELVDSANTNGLITDWSGSDPGGIAADNMVGHGGFGNMSQFNPFQGEIAAFRFYESQHTYLHIPPKPFRIEFEAPIRGQQQIIETNASPDRDILDGGDGDDVIVGNQQLDRIFGGSGADAITAEEIEVRDRDIADESLGTVPVSELIHGNGVLELDPIVINADAIVPPGTKAMHAAIAIQLGDPVTTSENGQMVLHRDLRASELNQMTQLHARSAGISDFTLLQSMPHLEVIDLRGNPITNDQLSQLTDLIHLRYLDLSQTNIDSTAASTIEAISALPNLETLYLPTENPPSFSKTVINSAATDASHVSTADVDGDGDLDIVGVEFRDNRTVWYENNGAQSYTSHVVFEDIGELAGYFATPIDLDGDGDIDIVNGLYDSILWHENNGSETFTTHVLYSEPNGFG